MKMGRHKVHKPTARSKRIASILVSLMMLSMIASTLHFTLVPHSIDFHTGKVVHAHSAYNVQSTHDHRHSTPKDNKNSSSGHECGVFAWMQQAKIFQSTEIIETIQQLNTELNSPLFAREIYLCRPVYPISPSHSPPGYKG